MKNTMKKILLSLCFLLITSFSFAGKSHPYYGGGHHTSSHGGYYSGSTNSHHKGGHYRNAATNNTYGKHK
jgi:hypothetical protein